MSPSTPEILPVYTVAERDLVGCWGARIDRAAFLFLPLPRRFFRHLRARLVLREDGSFAELLQLGETGGTTMHGRWTLDHTRLIRTVHIVENFDLDPDAPPDPDDQPALAEDPQSPAPEDGTPDPPSGLHALPTETKRLARTRPMPSVIIDYSGGEFIESRRLFGCRFRVRWIRDPAASPDVELPPPE